MSYPARMVMRARQLREVVAGTPMYSLPETADILEREFGRRPNVGTIRAWTNPEEAERHRRAAREHERARKSAMGARNGGRLGHAQHTIDFQEARCRALLSVAGMRATQVVRAMCFDYPDMGWTLARVRRVDPGNAAAQPARLAGEVLDEACREAARLYVDEGMSTVRIAAIQGVHPDTVGYRLRRAGVALRTRSEARQLRRERERAVA